MREAKGGCGCTALRAAHTSEKQERVTKTVCEIQKRMIQRCSKGGRMKGNERRRMKKVEVRIEKRIRGGGRMGTILQANAEAVLPNWEAARPRSCCLGLYMFNPQGQGILELP